MKTASFSQARRLTVITKKKGNPIVAARWDIDVIEKTNSWCLQVYEHDEVSEIAGNRIGPAIKSGTQIIWSKLTCLETGSHAFDRDAELAAKLSELKSYVGKYFHRFMCGSDKRSFSLNNTSIEPIDPFMTGEAGYQEGPSEKVRCKGGHIVISTHVLPHFKNMDTELLEKLGGADDVLLNQGLYLYREKRLISAGGWMGMIPNSRLGTLARVQVDIPSSLDNDWSTDVKKASLQVPPKVKRVLKKFRADPIRRSKRTYNYRGNLEVANRFWKICEDENAKTITYQIDPENDQLLNVMRECDPSEQRALIGYLKDLSSQLPINHIYETMSVRPREVNQKEVDMAALDALLNQIFEG